MTDLNPFGESFSAGTRKLPAAPQTRRRSGRALRAPSEGCFQRREVAHIGGDRADPRAERAQFFGRGVELALRAAADRDVGAERGEVPRDAEVDAAAAAGDEDRLALEKVRGKGTID